MTEQELEKMLDEKLDEMIDQIKTQVSPDEMLVILAEELMELAHAVLKVRRVLYGDEKNNPTPVTEDEAAEAMAEELSDVALCMRVLDLTAHPAGVLTKGMRWLERLSDSDGE